MHIPSNNSPHSRAVMSYYLWRTSVGKAIEGDFEVAPMPRPGQRRPWLPGFKACHWHGNHQNDQWLPMILLNLCYNKKYQNVEIITKWAQFHRAAKHKNALSIKFLPWWKQDYQPNFHVIFGISKQLNTSKCNKWQFNW